MLGRCERDQGGSAFLVEDGSIPIDDVGKGLATLNGVGHSPEDDVLEWGDGLGDGVGMEPVGAVVFEGGGVEAILDGDNEDAGA